MLRGLGKNEKLGPRGRWWLEEHAKYDDEHPVHALEIIKARVAHGEDPEAVTAAAIHSLTLMREKEGRSSCRDDARGSAAGALGLCAFAVVGAAAFTRLPALAGTAPPGPDRALRNHAG